MPDSWRCGVRRVLSQAILVCTVALVAGCGANSFDVPKDASGEDTLQPIVNRITCDLVDILRDANLRTELIAGNYDFAAQLTLKSGRTGTLNPTATGTFDVTGGSFLISGGVYANRTRDDTIVVNLGYSLTELDERWAKRTNTKVCHPGKTNLEGDLGIKKKVALILTAPNISGGGPSISGISGEFGGIVNFTTAKRLEGIGPTWMLRQFTGPRGFATVGVSSTDQIVFAFAPNKTPRSGASAPSPRARILLDEIISGDVGRKVDALANRF